MKQIDWEKIRQEEFPILNTMTFLDVEIGRASCRERVCKQV